MDSTVGSPICLCNEHYIGKLCDTPIRENNTHDHFNNTVHINNKQSDIRENKTYINRKCIHHSDKAICLCDTNDTKNDCELKRDSVTPAKKTIATVTKPYDTDFTKVKQHSHDKVTAKNLHIGDKMTSIHGDITNKSTQKPTVEVTSVNGRNRIKVTSGNKQHHLGVTIAKKLDGTEVASRNKHHREHNLSTFTDLDKFMHTEVTEEPFSIDNCSRNECVHGECKLENDIYRCQCHDGFKGQKCNISVHSTNKSTLSDESGSGRALEYVAITFGCICLFFLLFAGGFLWYKRAKRQRGSLYISSPIDFETKDTISKHNRRGGLK